MYSNAATCRACSTTEGAPARPVAPASSSIEAMCAWYAWLRPGGGSM